MLAQVCPTREQARCQTRRWHEGREPKKTCESTVGTDGIIPRHGGPNTCPSLAYSTYLHRFVNNIPVLTD